MNTGTKIGGALALLVVALGAGALSYEQHKTRVSNDAGARALLSQLAPAAYAGLSVDARQGAVGGAINQYANEDLSDDVRAQLLAALRALMSTQADVNTQIRSSVVPAYSADPSTTDAVRARIRALIA